ncbi:MAG: hypothetical protein MMC23_002452 [Stictis urceolatum]|nr:hypothetical protein [Stictis urceolata]
MLNSIFRWRNDYSPIAPSSPEPQPEKLNSSRHKPPYLLPILLFALGVLTGYTLSILPFPFPSPSHSRTPSTHSSCHNPSLRQEWRSLSSVQKHACTTAAHCLTTQPSRLSPNQTLYDDFPAAHVQSGFSSHSSAQFLPWHRYFLHVYEGALRKCGYGGPMAYWDWSLDWEDLTLAPVWDSDSFGGDGSEVGRGLVGENGELVNGRDGGGVMGGGCVLEGAFKGVRAAWLGPLWRPHCLSRGFLRGEGVRRAGRRNSPEALERLMRAGGYEEFLGALERGAHASVPKVVGGDFGLFTAPYGEFYG